MKPWGSFFVLGLIGLGLVPASRVRADIIQEDYRQRPILGGPFMTSGQYDPVDPYLIGTVNWWAGMEPLRPTELVRGGTDHFLAVLRGAFPPESGWTFVAADRDLAANSLVIHTYDVEGARTRVGAEFDAEYVLRRGNPDRDIHWIQVVTSNHPGGGGGVHGVISSVVDRSPRNTTTPYYDTGTGLIPNFYDNPGRGDADLSHFWTAELYLVMGPNRPGQVTIFNGIHWGWVNVVPEPSSLTVFVVGLVGALVLGYWRKREKKRGRSCCGHDSRPSKPPC
jgi:hypothetical protein